LNKTNDISESVVYSERKVRSAKRGNEHREKKTPITREEIHKLIVDNLIMRDQGEQTLTYRVSRPINGKNGLNEYVYHRIPVKRAQFDDQDDVSDINEVHVHCNDRVTITTNSENAESFHWIHPKGFMIENSDKYVVGFDEKALR
jgi:hypothetical protein